MLASSLDAAATDILSLFLSSYILNFQQHSSGISPSTLCDICDYSKNLLITATTEHRKYG